MTEHVISHRMPRRKRGGAWRLALRRFGALTVTLAALITANAIAPYIYRPPPAPPVVETPLPAPVKDAALRVVKVVAFGAAPAPVVERAAPPPRRRGVPLNAVPADAGEDFEVLTAAELDAISQARN